MWDGGDQVSQELATIQVPPCALLAVVVHRSRVSALRAHPGHIRLYEEIDIHGTLCKVERDAVERPGGRNAKELSIYIGILNTVQYKQPGANPQKML